MKVKVAELMMITFLGASGFASCNEKLLDLTSDGFRTKILSRVSISQSMVQEKLGFLYNLDEIEEKYQNAANFNSLYEKTITAEEVTPEFLAFSHTCHNLYESSIEQKEKVAIYMLFERVSDKYLAILTRSKKHQAAMQLNRDKENNSGWGSSTYGDADKIFDMFSSHTFVH